jgi:hypothetical protein
MIPNPQPKTFRVHGSKRQIFLITLKCYFTYYGSLEEFLQVALFFKVNNHEKIRNVFFA